MSSISGTTIPYFRSDELPPWEETVLFNGETDDLSTGWTFTVYLKQGGGSATPVLTKTTGITGSALGVVTINWAVGDLDIPAGRYRALIVGLRTVDSKEWTVEESITIRER